MNHPLKALTLGALALAAFAVSACGTLPMTTPAPPPPVTAAP